MTSAFSATTQQALARFVIGFGSELPGAVTLSLPGTITYDANGNPIAANPAGNSGYSIGTIQWDFGQRPGAISSLIQAYSFWMQTANNINVSQAELSSMAAALQVHGTMLRNNPALGLTQSQLSSLNDFIASTSGQDWVFNNLDTAIIGDTTHLNTISGGVNYGFSQVGAATQVDATATGLSLANGIANGTVTNKALLLAEVVGMKLNNQSPSQFQVYLSWLDGQPHSETSSITQLLSRIHTSIREFKTRLEPSILTTA